MALLHRMGRANGPGHARDGSKGFLLHNGNLLYPLKALISPNSMTNLSPSVREGIRNKFFIGKIVYNNSQ